jgi:hypothetical protein
MYDAVAVFLGSRQADDAITTSRLFGIMLATISL